MKIPPRAERDAALREFIETHSYFDEATWNTATVSATGTPRRGSMSTIRYSTAAKAASTADGSAITEASASALTASAS